jgi:hypothetical protein
MFMSQRAKLWIWVVMAGLALGVFLGNQNKFLDVNSSSCNWYTPGGWCPTSFSFPWFLGGLGVAVMIGFLIEILINGKDKK